MNNLFQDTDENQNSQAWKSIRAMPLEEQDAAVCVAGFGDYGDETDEALIESINVWMHRLLDKNPSYARLALALTRNLFIHEMARHKATD